MRYTRLALAGSVLLSACVSSTTSPTDNNEATNTIGGAAALHASYASATSSAPIVYPEVIVTSPPTQLTVGQGVSLTSIVHDSPTETHLGRSVAYTSTDTSVLKVSVVDNGQSFGDTAHVRAVKVGTASVIATTVSRTSDTVVIAVVAPTTGEATTTPPPVVTAVVSSLTNCLTPNVQSLNFSAGNFGSFSTMNLGDAHIVSDATAPSGKSLLTQWSYSPSSDEGSSVDANFSNRQTAYARFAYKQDTSFSDDGGIKKLIRFRQAGYGSMVGTLYINYGQLEWFYDDLYSAKDVYQNVGTAFSPDAFKGQWHWIEVYNDISHSGALHVEVWVDGALKMNQTVAASNQGISFGIVQFGGTYNAPAGNTKDWTDELGVSSGCIDAP